MERIVEPEWLDRLPAGDASAERSRSDLRRLNLIMRHASVIERELRRNPVTKRICDIGCGDGTLMLCVARQLRWRDVHLTLLDRQPVVTAGTLRQFEAIGWHVKIAEHDVAAAMQAEARFDVIIANLFLHHFEGNALKRLLCNLSERCRVFVAVEPRRAQLGLLAAACTGAVACGPVTRHDAIVSVRAGFRDREISALWPVDNRWTLTEKPSGLFSHLFAARRG